jgi:hypothetical protein
MLEVDERKQTWLLGMFALYMESPVGETESLL